MLKILEVTAPIYLIIALGYVAVRKGWMESTDMRALGRYVARFGLPALMYRAIAAQPLATILDARYLAVYAAGSLASLFAVRLVARRINHRSPSLAAIEGLGGACSNSAFVGYPIVLGVAGPVAGTALGLGALVENVLIVPLALALASAAPGEATRAWRSQTGVALRGLSRNPLFGGIVAGVIAAAFQWHAPAALDRGLALLGASASAASLFVIGGSLVGIRLAGIRSDIALVAVGKLVLHPGLVAVGVLLLPPLDPALRAAAILFAAMPMLSILPILAQPFGEQGVAAAAMLTVVVASFFTLLVVMWLLPVAWLPRLV